MPLKLVMISKQVNVTLTAVDIEPMKIDDAMFIIPEGVETLENKENKE